jgi:hypothetical protein
LMVVNTIRLSFILSSERARLLLLSPRKHYFLEVFITWWFLL